MGSKKRDEVIVGRGVGRPGGITPKIARTLLPYRYEMDARWKAIPPPPCPPMDEVPKNRDIIVRNRSSRKREWASK